MELPQRAEGAVLNTHWNWISATLMINSNPTAPLLKPRLLGSTAPHPTKLRKPGCVVAAHGCFGISALPQLVFRQTGPDPS